MGRHSPLFWPWSMDCQVQFFRSPRLAGPRRRVSGVLPAGITRAQVSDESESKQVIGAAAFRRAGSRSYRSWRRAWRSFTLTALASRGAAVVVNDIREQRRRTSPRSRGGRGSRWPASRAGGRRSRKTRPSPAARAREIIVRRVENFGASIIVATTRAFIRRMSSRPGLRSLRGRGGARQLPGRRQRHQRGVGRTCASAGYGRIINSPLRRSTSATTRQPRTAQPRRGHRATSCSQLRRGPRNRGERDRAARPDPHDTGQTRGQPVRGDQDYP